MQTEKARLCAVHCLGMVDYEQAWRLQEQYAAEIAARTRPPTLLLLEHPHTYTFGRRGDAANLLWDEAERARRGVSVHWVDRGGDVTYHGPGQLVGYPLLPLGALVKSNGDKSAHILQADYVGYIRKLEKTLIAALARLGVRGIQIDGLTGVWVARNLEFRISNFELAKVAAIGVKVDAHGISRHGFALNVDADMNYWQGIVGCGLKDHAVTSLAQLLPCAPPMETAISAVIHAFGETFDFDMQEL